MIFEQNKNKEVASSSLTSSNNESEEKLKFTLKPNTPEKIVRTYILDLFLNDYNIKKYNNDNF